MKTNLYIPKKIKVGFQSRKDTFTGKLAFVTYEDDKGLLRQENAWNGWRDKKIEPVEFENTPLSNFIFNKDVNRNGYWSDVTKVRIYDPRDFEFEIDVSNMMYILMHSDISKRDIAEECVFAWNGRNLILLPVNSEEYRKSVEATRKMNTKFSTKDLVAGHNYMTKKIGEVVYLGYYEWSSKQYFGGSEIYQNVGKKHVFYINKKYHDKFFIMDGKDLVEEVSNQVHPQYSHLVEELFKTKNMKKAGKISTKKGFETVGYKKTAYELQKVVISAENGNAHYKLYHIDLRINDDKPHFHNVKEMSYYYSTQIAHDLIYSSLDKQDPNVLKDYFVSKGFGELFYVNAEGKTIKL